MKGKQPIKTPLAGAIVGVFAIGLQFFGASRAVGGGPGPQILDLIPDSLQTLASLQGDAAQRADRFSELVIKAHPEVYQRLQTSALSRTAITSYLQKAPEYLSAVRDLHTLFEKQEPAIMDRFCAAFPDFIPVRTKIYLMLSLFRFDAKVPSDHSDQLLLGLDGLARFHGVPAPLAVILSHELFHLYHFQINPLPKNPDDLPLYRLLWQEGLAVYVSQQLNPGSSLADVLLDPRLAADGPSLVSAEAKRLLTCLDSKEDDIAAHFLAKSKNGNGPGRIGYLIAYDIVAKLAGNRSITSLARMRDPGLRFMFRREVYALAFPK